ncbi:MAG: hypothetical protein M3680_25710 [Myxococcota bacterium]|nr:hypothetical protein [Myxococcota bacterium]
MSPPRDAASPSTDAAAKRRWMIGIILSLMFGLFGAVMAWLNYAARTKSAATRGARPTAEPASTPDPAPRAPPGQGKGKDK